MTKYHRSPHPGQVSERHRPYWHARVPSTREEFPAIDDPHASHVRMRRTAFALALTAGLFLPGPWLAGAGAATSESAGTQPMMHPAHTAEASAPSETRVIIETAETWDEYRKKTDETYVDETGKTQPLYRLLEPEEGNTFLHIVAHVSTSTPQAYATDEILLIGPSTDDSVERIAPLATFGANGVPRVPELHAPTQKVALDLLYEVPQATWPEFFLELNGYQFGPLEGFIDARTTPDEAGTASRLR